jgi:hypothetical protein
VFKTLRANFAREGKPPIPAHPNGLKGGDSTKQLLEKLNKISPTTLAEYKEKNAMGFQLAVLCGFIKETENGILFTPQAAKSIKSLILTSQESIHKNCVGKHCGNKAKVDLDSIIDNLKAFEFVQTAVIHAIVRDNNTSEKHARTEKHVLSHIKKEDIEGNIIKLVVDKDVEDDKLDKFKTYLNNFSPHQLNLEFNVSTKMVNSKEEIDSIDLEEIFIEFVDQLKLDKDKEDRIKKIIDNLYAKNNL